jgi:putative DNA primase/helicase
MPTLALILHLVDVVDGRAAPGPVLLDAAKLAAAWVDFLDAHARRVYAVELDPSRTAARALVKHIEDGDVYDGDTVRDIYRRGWAGLQTRELVDDALRELQRLAWLRTEARETGGREARVIRLHPELRSADR